MMYDKLVQLKVNILAGRQRDEKDKNRFTLRILMV